MMASDAGRLLILVIGGLELLFGAAELLFGAALPPSTDVETRAMGVETTLRTCVAIAAKTC